MHDFHNDYSLAPGKLEITHQNILTKYCLNIANEYGIEIGGVNKSVSNLDNKNKYVVNRRNIHLYLSLGMKLIKVQRTLKFKQFDWLKKCINFNTDKRRKFSQKF